MTTTSYAPAPGAAPRSRMLAAQVGMEFRMLMRNGEPLIAEVKLDVQP